MKSLFKTFLPPLAAMLYCAAWCRFLTLQALPIASYTVLSFMVSVSYDAFRDTGIFLLQEEFVP